jgi:hypothetical protein
VIGLPALSGRGMKPRASSVLWMVFMMTGDVEREPATRVMEQVPRHGRILEG